jgi:hypothetical protein
MSVLTAPLSRSAARPAASAAADASAGGPHLILAGALPDAAWLSGSLRDQAIQTAAWQAFAGRARSVSEVLAAPGALAEPGHLRLLARLEGLPSAAAWPAIDMARRHQLPLNRPVWRVQPVHFLLGRDHVRLMNPDALALQPGQAEALQAAVGDVFREEGYALRMHSAREWSIQRVGDAPEWRLDTCSLAGAIGRSIDARLPGGPDARRWRRLLNEVQMIWHSHPVNEARQSQGLWPVNGLWLEGPASADPADPADPAECAAPGAHLDERLHQAQLSGDPQEWLRVWQALWPELLAQLTPGTRVALTGDAGWRMLELAAHRPWWKPGRGWLWRGSSQHAARLAGQYLREQPE